MRRYTVFGGEAGIVQDRSGLQSTQRQRNKGLFASNDWRKTRLNAGSASAEMYECSKALTTYTTFPHYHALRKEWRKVQGEDDWAAPYGYSDHAWIVLFNFFIGREIGLSKVDHLSLFIIIVLCISFIDRVRITDPTLHVPLEEIQVDSKLNFVEEPMEILEQELKKLKRIRFLLLRFDGIRNEGLNLPRNVRIR
ncbi:hypothetical protein Tco_1442338 [Tanacetum coccineum]